VRGVVSPGLERPVCQSSRRVGPEQTPLPGAKDVESGPEMWRLMVGSSARISLDVSVESAPSCRVSSTEAAGLPRRFPAVSILSSEVTRLSATYDGAARGGYEIGYPSSERCGID